MREELVHRLEEQAARAEPEYTRTEANRRQAMVEQRSRLLVVRRRVELVLHHQDDVHVVRFILGGDVAAEYNEPRQLSRVRSSPMNPDEPRGDLLPLGAASTEAGRDLVERGTVDSGRQLPLLAHIWQSHSCFSRWMV